MLIIIIILTCRELANQMRRTIESDDAVKIMMENKIKELNKELNFYKGDLEADFENNYNNNKKTAGVNLKFKKVELEYNLSVLKESKKYEYISNYSALANIHQARIYLNDFEDANKSFFKYKRICLFYRYLKYILSPFKNEIQYITNSYNEDVIVLFKIARKFFVMSIFVSITFVYFFFFHIIKLVDNYSKLDNKFNNSMYSSQLNMLCKHLIPCAALYSRIDQTSQAEYSISLLFMSLVIIYEGVSFYITFINKRKKAEIYEKENKKLSRYFFNCWDWSVNSKTLYTLKKKSLRKLLSITFKEYLIKENNYYDYSEDEEERYNRIKEKVKYKYRRNTTITNNNIKNKNILVNENKLKRPKRNNCDIFKLYLLRLFLWFVWFIILIISLSSVLGVYNLRNYIKKQFIGDIYVTEFNLVFLLVSIL